MWPGVFMVHNQEYQKDDVVCIVKHSSSQVIAVGAMASDYMENNAEGVAVYLLHHFNDKLYEISPQTFTKKIIQKKKNSDNQCYNQQDIFQELEVDDDNDEEDYEDNIEQLMNQMKGNCTINNFLNEKENKKQNKKVQINIFEDLEDEEENQTKKIKNRKNSEQTDCNSRSFSNYSNYCENECAEKDDWIEACFLKAVNLKVEDKQLPMDPSVMFNLMCQCKGEGDNLDLKNSSYKKIGRFFRRMSKERLIDYKLGKKGADQPMVTKIYREHKKFQDYEGVYLQNIIQNSPKIKKKKKEPIDSRLVNGVTITELFKVRKEYSGVIRAVGGDGSINIDDAKESLMAYCYQWGLIEKKKVILDALLISLFVKQKVQNNIVEMDKDELMKRIDYGLIRQHIVIDKEGNRQVRSGMFKGLTLVAEKAHNKKVTRVQGLELFCLDIHIMYNYLQFRYASSVTTHDTIGKNGTGKELVIQGHFVDELIDLFLNECAIPKQYIKAINKLDRKKN